MDFEYKMVLVTRKDLPVSMGKLAVQIAHAAVNCSLITKKNHPKWFAKWQHEGAKKVVVSVDTLQDFQTLQNKAKKLDIDAELISDAGHTEISAGTITVLGLGPAPSNLIDQVTKELPLL
jgi:PTH2 family peptidyl-tRNA hydrolase